MRINRTNQEEVGCAGHCLGSMNPWPPCLSNSSSRPRLLRAVQVIMRSFPALQMLKPVESPTGSTAGGGHGGDKPKASHPQSVVCTKYVRAICALGGVRNDPLGVR